MTIYHMIIWFFVLSFFGYLLECVVLSCENRTAVLNRGFVHGPFCIIYGFGGLGAYLILAPVSAEPVQLFAASMVMATMMELLTAEIMIRLFGSFWWDYSHKHFNYKGMICLESSIGWGFLGIFFFRFLDGFTHSIVYRIPEGIERWLACGLVCYYIADFLYTLRLELDREEEEERPIVGRLKIY